MFNETAVKTSFKEAMAIVITRDIENIHFKVLISWIEKLMYTVKNELLVVIFTIVGIKARLQSHSL